jgi:excisionase family DNA binding protein
MPKKTSVLLKPEEVADLLQVARKTVIAMAREQRLPHIRVGRYYRFDSDEVDRWIDRQRA